MRVLFLADSDSPHTVRWVKSLYKHQIEVGIFSIHIPKSDLYSDSPDIFISSLNASRELQTKKETNLGKLIYFNAVYKVKKLLKSFKPDIVHSHYASSYGLIGALSGFHPYVISVWGSDIYSFPNYSNFYGKILKYSLGKADKVLATSKVLLQETKKYYSKEIILTPFGIDTKKFSPDKTAGTLSNEGLVIGTIKTLEENYGVEYLIKAFHILKTKYPEKSLRLLIVGKGTQREKLEKLVKDLGIENETTFTGFIPYDGIQEYQNMLDIFVAVSQEESFGVAVLEASACEKPVVVSNVGGLPEVVTDGETGFLVEKNNPAVIAEALEKLVLNPELRSKLGQNGRAKVLREYKWEESVRKMLSVYDDLFSQRKFK